MPARKRGHEEMASEAKPDHAEASLLDRIRSMSEFAALWQFIFMFGKAVKVDDVDIEDLEQECILPMHSALLSDIGLSLLKFVSSFRALTHDNFEEYTRRQYLVKAPGLNPFGDDEEPRKFPEMDVFTKIRILHQLTLFTFWNPDKIREKLPDASMDDQINWRMNPCGWDSEDRTYFILDDDRLYRQTDPAVPEPTRKDNRAPKKGRSQKRRRLSRVIPDTTEDEIEDNENVADNDTTRADYESNFEGRKWECIAVSLEEYNRFLDKIKKSRDPDERNLCRHITNEILPLLDAKEEARQKKEHRRLRELENMEKLLSAKRSSRLAGKQEKKKEQEEAEEAERRRREDIAMAHKEEAKQKKIEEARESRMQTREQRIREREVKRILNEERLKNEEEQLVKLTKLTEGEASLDGRGRISERQLKADVERRQLELQQLQQYEEEWIFDCAVCGVHGQNWDDGTHSIACDECNVWQHSSCHGIAQEQAGQDDFHFVCNDCKKKKEKKKESPKIKVFPKAKAPAMVVSPKAATTAPAQPTPVRLEVALPKPAPPPRAYPGPPPQVPRRSTHAVPISSLLSSNVEPAAKQSLPASNPPQSYQSYGGTTNGTAHPLSGGISRPFAQSMHQPQNQPLPRTERPHSASRQLPLLNSSPRSTSASYQSTANLGTPYQRNGSFGTNGHNHLTQTPVQHVLPPSGSFTYTPTASQSPRPALHTPHLPSPKQMHTPVMGSTSSFAGGQQQQNGLEGSSPGFSPVKQPSPPRPASNGVDGALRGGFLGVRLEPTRPVEAGSPPMKKSASPLMRLPLPVPVTTAGRGVVVNGQMLSSPPSGNGFANGE